MGYRSGIENWGLEKLVRHLGPVVVRLLGRTLRIERRGIENIDKAKRAAKSVIYAFWHGRFLPLTYIHRNEGINVLVSTHQDGEYVASVIEALGFDTVRGSSTRGGAMAMLKLLETGADRRDMGVAPDGPRGPRERCQVGAIYVAKKTGLPIIPIGVSQKPSLILTSWDRFMVPLPFARCIVVYGEPAFYDRSLSEEVIEEAKTDLEHRLKAVTKEADDACGQSIK